MKFYSWKIFLIAIGLINIISKANAQFDDVYYDPDQVIIPNHYNFNDNTPEDLSNDDVTYYDNDEYQYYDEDDYYYSSRIRRFHGPTFSFGFFAPFFTASYYYDPYCWDDYYYGGPGFYLGFGWNYNYWNNWGYYNNYYPYSSCYSPYNYYYPYNNCYSPYYSYWGGCNGYGGYNGHYGYSNGCGGYGGGTCGPYYGPGTYYGPRITGNAGTSPRIPPVNPGLVQPVFEANHNGLTESNEKPIEPGNGINPVTRPQSPMEPGSGLSPDVVADHVAEKTKDGGRTISVDRELNKNETSPSPQRPVFKPAADRFQPYPTDEETSSVNQKPIFDEPAPKTESANVQNFTPQRTPGNSGNSSENSIEKEPRKQTTFRPYPGTHDNEPGFDPAVRTHEPSRNEQRPTGNDEKGSGDRSFYSPPERNHESSRGEEQKPSYSPQPRHEESRSNEKSYEPPPSRSHDSGGSNDRPSYSPPSGGHSSGGSSGQAAPSAPSRSNSSPPSGGGSPRSPGRN